MIDFLTHEERHQLLVEFNNTNADYPKDKTIIDLFEYQVSQTPDNTAVVFEQVQLTYQQLNEKANQLGSYLREKYSIAPDDLIGIKLDRSERMIIAVLGVLKSGAAYVPIDPNYPEERIAYIEKDSNCKVVINEDLLKNFIEEDYYSSKNIEKINDTHDLAYVIYTSGTTGNPKGVMVENNNVVRLFKTDKSIFDFNSNDIWSMFHSYCFDFSVWEMYGALLNGGKLVIIPLTVARDPIAFLDLLTKEKVTVLNQTPSVFYTVLSEDLKKEETNLSLRYVIFGGESLIYGKLAGWEKKYPATKLINMYGITETTVHVTYKEITEKEIIKNINNIGKPIPTLSCYVLDQNQNLLPIGVSGELYIGGEGVARGYLNRQSLTNERFIESPFKSGDRLYRSGDEVRMLENGEMEYLGRKDQQVKIRGFRIELGEIENAILQYSGDLQQVIVEAKEVNQDKALIAYFTSLSKIDKSNLRVFLEKKLPEYMIPVFYVELKEFGLTDNGKIDRKILPVLTDKDIIRKEFLHPNSKEEQILVSVWEAVLKREHISIKDNYYNLGGDSIKSIQIVSNLKRYGYSIKIQNVLQVPVLEEMAKHLEVSSHFVDQSPVFGEINLTSIQVFFFQSPIFKNHHFYNQSLLLKSQEALNSEFLSKTIAFLTEHHDVLRMIYKKENGGWKQFNQNLSNKSPSIPFYDLQNQQNSLEIMADICQNLQSSFNLETGPLFKVGHFRLNDGDRLALIIHHLLIDGISWRILLEDLTMVYSQYKLGEKPVLPLKTDSFQRWSFLQKEYAFGNKLKFEKPYWENVCKGDIPLFPKNIDCKLPVKTDNIIKFTLNESMTELLQTKVHKVYNTTINDVLLSCLGIAVQKTFGVNKTVIKMEGHGREDIIPDIDISRTIGWFTTFYPFMLNISVSESVLTNLVEVKEAFRKIPNKGIGYGILQYLTDDYKDELKYDIEFNYLGDFDGAATNGSGSYFEYANEYIGSNNDSLNESDVAISVSGILVNKELTIAIAFSKEVYHKETIQELVNYYHASLRHMIEELCRIKESYLTPSDLTYKVLSLSDLTNLNRNSLIEDIYKLSPLQQGIYYLWLYKKSNSMYFEQMSYRIKAVNLDVAALKNSYDQLVFRHGILRTSFTSSLGEYPLQIVKKEVPSNFSFKKLPYGTDTEIFVRQEKLSDKEKGFDLEAPSQMRLQVLDLGKSEYEFIWSHHHILIDGWCMSILINDFYEILNSFSKNQIPNLAKPIPYSNYIKWLDNIDTNESLGYWKNYLKGYSNVADVPFKKSLEKDILYLETTETLIVDGDLYNRINQLCISSEITQSTFLQAVWGFLLSKYNNTNDVVFGAVVSGRPGDLEGVENMIGLFINTIPVRVSYDEETTVFELLKKVKDDAILSNPHHYLNLSEVQSQSELGMDLINHIMIFENYPVQKLVQENMQNSSQAKTFNVENIEVFEQTNYDFNILIAPSSSSLRIDFKYNINKYDAQLMKNMINHIYELLEQFSFNADRVLNKLTYLKEAEKFKVLFEFNDTDSVYHDDKTIVDLFQEQVEKTPNSIALLFKDVELTYQELNEKSNQFGDYLRRTYTITPDDLIPVKLERSERMIISILGILKAGAAYVPIDINYPHERISYIEQDCSSKIIVDEFELIKFNEVKENYSKENLEKVNQAKDLVYVIYTSGTSGDPKGVMIEHSSLLNRLEWMQKTYPLDNNDVILQKTNYSFDVSVWELFWWMYKGSKLCLLKPGEQNNPEEIITHIEKFKVSVLHFVPSMLSIFLDYLKANELDKRKLGSVKQVFVSGEALSVSLNNNFFDQFTDLSLINLYGPTEATIDVSHFKCTHNLEIVPIGKPIDNIKLFILDKNLQPVPIGVVGKLFISGAGVARSYLNKPHLTQEKFIVNPFIKQSKMYDTGDQARWLSDGNIEFLGRTDHQVKIRGFRIELEEIENAISQFSQGLRKVIVEAKEHNNEKVLIAYLVSSMALNKTDLRHFLLEKLPNYMVPSFFVELDSLPLTSNGKINRRALPNVNGEDLIRKVYLAPRNEIEKKLVKNIASILNCEESQVGINDNFFDLGINSLKLISLMNSIRKELNLPINISLLFEFPNVRELSNKIYDLTNVIEEKIEINNVSLSEEIDDFLNHFSD